MTQFRTIYDRTEIFNALSVIEAPLSDEDRVIYLLASLPESFGVLVTALEASAKMGVVTERLLHEERKLREKEEVTSTDAKAMATQSKWFKKRGSCHLLRKVWTFQERLSGIS